MPTPLLALCLVGLVLASPLTLYTQSAADRASLQEIDAFIERAMAANVTPGLSVAIVRGSEVIYAKGFGFADRELGRRATADTQFYIASTTKSFTALAAALLGARGELSLDEPLSQALTRARFHPDINPAQITLRDLLTHTHGLKSGGAVDFRTAFSGEFTSDELFDLLRFHGPATTGRAFAYSNLGYNIYAMALDQKFKSGWKEVLQREVFDPLAMRSTTAYMSKGDPARLAQPYELRTDGPERVTYAKQDANMQAAGGHLSTANDLARYLIVHLNGGRIGGRQVLPEAAVNETHRKQAEQSRRTPLTQVHGWGLGWDLATYDGDAILRRYGGFPGFHAQISLMPERGLGVVVLANGGSASVGVADLTAAFAYDLLLGKPSAKEIGDKRWAAFAADLDGARAALAADVATRKERQQPTPLALDAYAGTYENPALGHMIWTFENGRLKAAMGIAGSDVEVQDAARNQFRVELTGGGAVVTFDVPAESRRPTSLRFLNEIFTRVP
jgi:CubicO group peptidase (beta-lactamase class C family)